MSNSTTHEQTNLIKTASWLWLLKGEGGGDKTHANKQPSECKLKHHVLFVSDGRVILMCDLTFDTLRAIGN